MTKVSNPGGGILRIQLFLEDETGSEKTIRRMWLQLSQSEKAALGLLKGKEFEVFALRQAVDQLGYLNRRLLTLKELADEIDIPPA